jgi:hypothetical protein
MQDFRLLYHLRKHLLECFLLLFSLPFHVLPNPSELTRDSLVIGNQTASFYEICFRFLVFFPDAVSNGSTV